MEAFRTVCRRIELYGAQTLRPLLSAGEFLVVLSFIDHGSKGLTQWGHYLWFLHIRKGVSKHWAKPFHLANVAIQLGGSGMVIVDWKRQYAAALLMAELWIAHALAGHDAHLWWNTISRAASLAVILLNVAARRERLERQIQLVAGRALVILIFIGFNFQHRWSTLHALISVFGVGACCMLAMGPKRRWSGAFLVLVLSLPQLDIFPHRETELYLLELHPALSIAGGLVLLNNMGALGDD
ncbi:hypothetical protein DFH06DRAFT_284341 [Mycena polygramma]|nr:hypothetical protein DFH06DRAFT_284341 [Mycena polygramma]